jgi:hypothetical protein
LRNVPAYDDIAHAKELCRLDWLPAVHHRRRRSVSIDKSEILWLAAIHP